MNAEDVAIARRAFFRALKDDTAPLRLTGSDREQPRTLGNMRCCVTFGAVLCNQNESAVASMPDVRASPLGIVCPGARRSASGPAGGATDRGSAGA